MSLKDGSALMGQAKSEETGKAESQEQQSESRDKPDVHVKRSAPQVVRRLRVWVSGVKGCFWGQKCCVFLPHLPFPLRKNCVRVYMLMYGVHACRRQDCISESQAMPVVMACSAC